MSFAFASRSSVYKAYLCLDNSSSKPLLNISLCKRNITNPFRKTVDKVVEPQIEEDPLQDDKELERIDKIRNKSRLRPHDRNLLFDKKPYNEPMTKVHLTVKYNREMLGKYGTESGVNPGISWPRQTDLHNRQEYEQVAYPLTIQEMIKVAKEEIEEKDCMIKERQEHIINNIAKLENWKKDLKLKIAKKEAEALAAQEKKEKLIEEVRRHFGYTVDVRDEKFKEMLALKQKEQRKKDKIEKEKERENKMLTKLMSQHDAKTTSV